MKIGITIDSVKKLYNEKVKELIQFYDRLIFEIQQHDLIKINISLFNIFDYEFLLNGIEIKFKNDNFCFSFEGKEITEFPLLFNEFEILTLERKVLLITEIFMFFKKVNDSFIEYERKNGELWSQLVKIKNPYNNDSIKNPYNNDSVLSYLKENKVYNVI